MSSFAHRALALVVAPKAGGLGSAFVSENSDAVTEIARMP